jgi:hypothetical protein
MNTESKLSLRSTRPCLDDLFRLVRGEYDEMPGLSLTMAQAQRLWTLDRTTCALVLGTLVETRFLRTTARGRYVRMK